MKILLGALILLTCLAAPASAAVTVSFEQGNVVLTGADNDEYLSISANGAAARFASADITLASSAQTAGCTQPSSFQIDCPQSLGAAHVVDLRGGADGFGGSTLAKPLVVNGGAGADFLQPGAGPNELRGGPDNDNLIGGPAADRMFGEAGNDIIHLGSAGSDGAPDDVSGGGGIDAVSYPNSAGPPLSLTLDDVANDGRAGEADNLRSDIEDVVQEFLGGIGGPFPISSTADTIVGSAAMNAITGGGGGERIDPGPGSDFVRSRTGDDTVQARDGYVDRVECGEGLSDVANVDGFDSVGDDCETVNRADAGNAADDAPPSAGWVAPAAGATLSTSAANELAVNASDAVGIAQVVFFAGDRTLCTLKAPPYSCSYSPAGSDVGKVTLIAVAVDTAGQTATIFRTVTVPRFAATLTAATTPKRDRRAPFTFITTGKLTFTAPVSEDDRCTGRVTIILKLGKRTVSTRQVTVGRDCTFRSRATLKRVRRGRLSVRASYAGTDVLLPTTATVHTVRAG